MLEVYSHKFYLSESGGKAIAMHKALLAIQEYLSGNCIFTITQGNGYWDEPECAYIVEHISDYYNPLDIAGGKLVEEIRRIGVTLGQSSIMYTRQIVSVQWDILHDSIRL